MCICCGCAKCSSVLAQCVLNVWRKTINKENLKMKQFNIGDKFEATIKSVRDEGVYIYMGKGGSGTISPA